MAAYTFIEGRADINCHRRWENTHLTLKQMWSGAKSWKFTVQSNYFTWELTVFSCYLWLSLMFQSTTTYFLCMLTCCLLVIVHYICYWQLVC